MRARENPAASAVGVNPYADAFVCIIEVTPNLDPPYVTRGFFTHEGAGWRYYGALSAVHIDRYDALSLEDEGLRPKPGARPYDGDAFAHSDDNARSPYRDILSSLGVPGF